MERLPSIDVHPTSLRLDGVRVVVITDARIAAVEADLPDDAAYVIDAGLKLVPSGLRDIHTHDARVAEGPPRRPARRGDREERDRLSDAVQEP